MNVMSENLTGVLGASEFITAQTTPELSIPAPPPMSINQSTLSDVPTLSNIGAKGAVKTLWRDIAQILKRDGSVQVGGALTGGYVSTPTLDCETELIPSVVFPGKGTRIDFGGQGNLVPVSDALTGRYASTPTPDCETDLIHSVVFSDNRTRIVSCYPHNWVLVQDALTERYMSSPTPDCETDLTRSVEFVAMEPGPSL